MCFAGDLAAAKDVMAARTSETVVNPLWILGLTLGLTLSIASSDPSNARLHAKAELIEKFPLHLAEPLNKSWHVPWWTCLTMMHVFTYCHLRFRNDFTAIKKRIQEPSLVSNCH